MVLDVQATTNQTIARDIVREKMPGTQLFPPKIAHGVQDSLTLQTPGKNCIQYNSKRKNFANNIFNGAELN